VTALELLARCRAALGGATERVEAAVYDRLPRHPRAGDGQVAHRLCLEVSRDEVDALVRDLDQALTGDERDHLRHDYAAAANAVLALPRDARDQLLIDLLAARGTP
jgi:hypothetical protein